jgi:homogentisate 1,2-dioxygenase
MNNPQVCPYGLYAEQLSGTAFTAPRSSNRRSWLYRIRPAVMHSAFKRIDAGRICSSWTDAVVDPNQLRWGPEPLLSSPSSGAGGGGGGVGAVDFIQGLATMAGGGDPVSKQGLAIHMYNINANMVNCAMFNSDGDFLIIPETGTLLVRTELGDLTVEPCEVVVVPRGVRFAVETVGVDGQPTSARGYVMELYEGHFDLPGLGEA